MLNWPSERLGLILIVKTCSLRYLKDMIAAGRLKILLIISVWFVALSYTFEFGKHCKSHVRTIKVPFSGNSIKGSTLCRNWLTIRRYGKYLKSRTAAIAPMILT